jgi:hypothetical protein
MRPPTCSCFRARPTHLVSCCWKRSPAACRVAAFPVTGPRDVIGTAPIGALNDDLRLACLSALLISPQACLEFAARYSWEASARVFVEHALNVRAADPEGEAVGLVAVQHRP